MELKQAIAAIIIYFFMLLIVPYGIETSMIKLPWLLILSFNRTLWN